MTDGPNVRFWYLNHRFWRPNHRFGAQIIDSGAQIIEFGGHVIDSGSHAHDSGTQILDVCAQTMNFGVTAHSDTAHWEPYLSLYVLEPQHGLEPAALLTDVSCFLGQSPLAVHVAFHILSIISRAVTECFGAHKSIIMLCVMWYGLSFKPAVTSKVLKVESVLLLYKIVTNR